MSLAMGGHRQTKAKEPTEVDEYIFAGQDRRGVYRKECIAFADDIHFRPEQVTAIWSQVALLREFENKEPRAVAEFLAMRNVREALDCRGREAS